MILQAEQRFQKSDRPAKPKEQDGTMKKLRLLCCSASRNVFALIDVRARKHCPDRLGRFRSVDPSRFPHHFFFRWLFCRAEIPATGTVDLPTLGHIVNFSRCVELRAGKQSVRHRPSSGLRYGHQPGIRPPGRGARKERIRPPCTAPWRLFKGRDSIARDIGLGGGNVQVRLCPSLLLRMAFQSLVR